MNILLTNDDGVHAPGIARLAGELSKKHQVFIVAPSGERSAGSHSITMNLPLFVRRISLDGLENIETYSVSGTPADSVKIGIGTILKTKPDLVVSGINPGLNLGSDIFYSGTTSAALESAVMGYKGLAVSLQMEDNRSMEYLVDAAKYVSIFLDQIDILKDIDQVVNMNVPALPFEDIKGFKVARQGKIQYDERFEKRLDPRGREYYWLAGENIGKRTSDETDSKILHEGYISLTPLRCDLTDYDHMDRLKCKFENIKLQF